MKKLRALIVSMAVIGSILLLAPAASASGPIGSCGSPLSNKYRSGDTYGQAAFTGVYATAQVPNSLNFGPCSPDDNVGGNVSAVQIGISNGVAFVSLGIMICNTRVNSSDPASACDGSRHFYAEQHGLASFDYNLIDLGYADLTQHQLQITNGQCGGGLYCWYVDGVLKWYKNMGSGLDPRVANQTVSWQFETQDPGDGLGQNVSGYSTNIGSMESQFNGGWHYHAVGTSCDTVSSQHRCVPNGSYGMYAYTLN